jgi:hypothetical protein
MPRCRFTRGTVTEGWMGRGKLLRDTKNNAEPKREESKVKVLLAESPASGDVLPKPADGDGDATPNRPRLGRGKANRVRDPEGRAARWSDGRFRSWYHFWYRLHRPTCPLRPHPGTQGRRGRGRTQRAVGPAGWGPSGRWFKSSRPDDRKPALEAASDFWHQPQSRHRLLIVPVNRASEVLNRGERVRCLAESWAKTDFSVRPIAFREVGMDETYMDAVPRDRHQGTTGE